MVGHPSRPDAIPNESNCKEMLDSTLEQGNFYRHAKSCGMHVHLNRSYLTEKGIVKIVNLPMPTMT